MKKRSLLLFFVICIATMVFSQNKPWKEQGNNASSSSKLGTLNNEPVRIITNDQERMLINENGGVEINDYLKVNGYTETDSLYVRGALIISKDSSSFYFDPNVGACDRMRVSTGNFAIMHGVNLPPPWGAQLVTPFVKVGIGTQNAQSKLHLFHPAGNVFSQTTNNTTGVTSTDGFLVGIAADGTAELIQQENMDLVIYTGDLTDNHSRMIIKGESGTTQGFVAIGRNFNGPVSLLSIDGTNDNTGEVFRTNTVSGLNTFWRMQRKDEPIGNIFSRANGPLFDRDNFSLQATAKDITFHTQPLDAGNNDIGEERMRIVGVLHSFAGVDVLPGNVAIGNKHPYSMLHIGDDLDINSGWRDWMNVGTLYADHLLDNMYIGLKHEGIDRNDAIINWGNNPLSQVNSADRLRFVFTSYPALGLPASGDDGLEIARMISDGTTGRMGIGDFYTINEDPTQVLDVIGNARLRELPAASWHDETLVKCVVVDDDGVLHWRNFNGSGTGGSLGNICAGPTSNPLLNDWEIPLNDNNFVFSGQGAGNNRVGIGIAGCQPAAKLDVLMNTGESGSIALKSVVENGENSQIGIFGHSTTSSPLTLGIGIFGLSQFSNINMGVTGIAWNAIPAIMDATYNFGGFFMADYGWINAAGYFNAPSNDPSSLHNYGVYAICPPNPDDSGVEYNWAGYFIGSVHVEGNITYTGNCNDVSDQQFKKDVHDYAGGIDVIRELRPVTYYYDTVNYNLNFPTDIQYGLIAQDVEPILPDLVSDQMIPEKFDTAGYIISESIQYKGLDYIQFTPILIQAVKELDENLSVLLKMPEIPELIVPQNNINVKYGTKIEFKWHKSEDTQYYIFDLAFDPAMSDIYYTTNINDTVTAFEFTLNTDTTIYWAVRAVNSYGRSDFSEIRHLNYTAGFVKSTSQSFAELSDINMKTDIVNIEDALTKTMTLQGVSFSWDTINNPNRNLSDGTHLGLIAQDVQQVFPEVVSNDVNGYLYIDYSSLVPVLIESVKDLKYINDSLNQRLNDLETSIDNIEQFLYGDLGDVQMKNTNEPLFSQEVTLENSKAIVLNQNVPNPFKEQTTISFQIPENIESAKIVFIDNLGNILKQVDITDRGYGELIVYAHDLSSGNYTYYLVADGKTIESKKMVLTR